MTKGKKVRSLLFFILLSVAILIAGCGSTDEKNDTTLNQKSKLNNIQSSNETTRKNEPSSKPPYTKEELKADKRAPSKDPLDYNKDGQFVPKDGPSRNPADYNSKGEYRPIEKMTQKEIEEELIKMIEDALK